MEQGSRRWRLPAGLLVGGVLLVASAPPVRAAAPEPMISVTPGESAPGQVVTVRLDNWPASTANVSVCGNSASRGSEDCDVRAAQGVAINERGSTFLSFALTVPPVGCPCVVRAESPTGVVRTTTVELAGVPVVAPIPPTGPGQATQVAISTEVLGGDRSWAGAFGGPTSRRVRVTLRNNGITTVSGLRLVAYLGRDRSSGEPVESRPVAALGPGSSVAVEFPVDIAAPAFGDYEVFGRVYGLDRPVPFAATTNVSPWAWEVIIPLVLLVLARVLRRRDRARAEQRARLVATEVTPAPVPVLGATEPVTTSTPARTPAPVSVTLHERSPDVVSLDEGRSAASAYDPHRRREAVVADERGDLAGVAT